MQEDSCSSSYLNDFESYAEKNWSFRVGRDNYSTECKTPEKNFGDFPATAKFYDVDEVPSFGVYVERYDWIECVSKSIPGKTYYYNLRSGCSTWNRPISRYVRIQHHPHRESSFRVEQCYLQDQSYVASDDGDDRISVGESSIKLEEKNRLREWILEQLYYNTKKKKKYVARSWKRFANNNKPSSLLSDFSTSVYTTYNDDKGIVNQNKDDCSDSVTDNSSEINEASRFIDMANFLECSLSEYTEFERYIDSRSMKAKLINNIYNYDENDSDLSLSIDNNREDNKLAHFVPRLKRIKFRDMLLEKTTKKNNKQRKPKRTAEIDSSEVKKEELQRSKKIICNMYGVTTVNYDDYEQQSQPRLNVKGCNLSDSSNVVSLITEKNHSRSSILKHFGRDDLDKTIPPLILSDSNSSSTSSSSSSFTCDTCSSTSSTSSDSSTV